METGGMKGLIEVFIWGPSNGRGLVDMYCAHILFKGLTIFVINPLKPSLTSDAISGMSA